VVWLKSETELEQVFFGGRAQDVVDEGPLRSAQVYTEVIMHEFDVGAARAPLEHVSEEWEVYPPAVLKEGSDGAI